MKIACLTAKHFLALKYNKATVKRQIPFASSSLAIFLYRGSFLLTKVCTELQNDELVFVILNSVTGITTAQTQVRHNIVFYVTCIMSRKSQN